MVKDEGWGKGKGFIVDKGSSGKEGRIAISISDDSEHQRHGCQSCVVCRRPEHAFDEGDRSASDDRRWQSLLRCLGVPSTTG